MILTQIGQRRSDLLQMDLCHDCDGFAFAISRGLERWPGLDSFWSAARRRAGSQDCRLCKMMSDYIFENPDVYMVIQPGSNSPSLEYGTPDMTLESPLSHVFLAGGGDPGGRAEISVWSDPGKYLLVNDLSYPKDRGKNVNSVPCVGSPAAILGIYVPRHN